MVAVPGRVLAAPKVMYSGNSTAKALGGSWNMMGKKVAKPATLSDWTTLRIGGAANIDAKEFRESCYALTAGFRSCGLNIQPPQVFPGPTIPALKETQKDKVTAEKVLIDSKLRKIFEECKTRKISMLLVVLPSTKPWIRERVKFWGDNRYGKVGSVAFYSE